ncbi:BTAD domain-containing putative transcriptional regulator [Herbiconiux sp. KACC 21604]|uniref:BTAD domain-containing putative transcriptional regulator n=1 Tax=unclassified Herbiconiux TaxID=2618217 RepID=UPI0014929E4D|nr:BTAD domain-containing putative transcriptional regulator [Herbiconiux sp. SALV-R1]QJU52827.1 tetratricopeptide repeat protein [Herbiconiux sp. SALV-R1]WPO87740.1 BTAD domain-containing putative transcriptional regulator [Herbiconiux sp. KACC 21604]
MSDARHPTPVAGGEPSRVAVLGPVAVLSGTGERVEPAGLRARTLVVALALAAPRSLTTAQLIDEVWGDDPPAGAKAALQTLVSRLRATVGDEIVVSLPSGYRLDIEPDELDLGAAEDALDRARAALDDGDDESAHSLARSALALWRAEPGADLGAGATAEALRERAAAASHGLTAAQATAALRLGRALEAEELARRLTAVAPFDDSARLLLMQALDALGRPTEALEVFAQYRSAVQETFGTSPSPELQALHLELLARDDVTPGAPRSAVVVAPPPVARASTPTAIVRGVRAAPNALIGRDGDLAALEQLLRRSRITTVLGPGGLGKTRIAHELAARAASAGAFESIVVVELAGVRSGDDVVFALAAALGIREVATSRRIGDQVVRADLRTRILNRLGERRTLLVVDNCEHLIEAAAAWCAELTGELPELTVLTTSRTPLAISSERVYALPPLGRANGVAATNALAPTGRASGAAASSTIAPSASAPSTTAASGPGPAPAAPVHSTPLQADPTQLDDPAVRLFVDRATAARPDALLPLDTVARLCSRLDGLPLAIELAAARIRSLSIDEIERRLSNRFVLLTGGDRSAPERHRTLFAVIEWSWNLLGRDEQRALACLSEFADGFGLEGAAAVLGVDELEALELLDALVAQSLVVMVEGRVGMRYRMLETVREFGQQQLDLEGRRDAVRDALFGWADALALRLLPDTDGARQVETFAVIAVEEDNLIDLLRRAIDSGRAEVVASVFALLGYYWSLRSAHSEVLAFSRPVYEVLRGYAPNDARRELLTLGLVIVVATNVLTDLRFAVRPLSQLRRLVSEHPPVDERLATMAGVLLASGDENLLRGRVEVAMKSSHRPTTLLGAIMGSVWAENEGRRADAVASARAAARLAESLDDTWGGAMAAQMLGALHSQSNEPTDALRWAEQARTGLARLGAADDLRQIEWVIASNQIATGEFDAAREVFERLVVSPGESDGVDIAAIGHSGLAELARAEGRFADAREHYARAVGTFASAPRMRASPWYLIVLSAALVAQTLDALHLAGAHLTPESLAAERLLLARRLRSRTLATLRMGGRVDHPVLGASVIGLAVWVQPFHPDVTLELLTLAESMGARQDSPALHLGPLLDGYQHDAATPATSAAASTASAADPLSAARASAAALPAVDRPARITALLGTPAPWSWGWH